MTFGKQGKGAGIPNTKPGDRYEGEFHGGFAHGVGMFTSADGVVFKGEFSAGLRDGCGGEYDLSAWHKRMKKGMDPAKAWKEAKEEIQESVVMGTWNNDVFTTGPTDLGTGCSIGEIKRTMYESDSIVARARMFQFKPGGDVRPQPSPLPVACTVASVASLLRHEGNLHAPCPMSPCRVGGCCDRVCWRKAGCVVQANFYKCHQHGAPLKAMQHPLHYPHGTLFMAPGPAGQTAAIPNDKGLKRLMLREFHNYNVVFSSYNFDFKPASDSLMAKAMRWWDKQQALRKREEALEAKIADQQMRRCCLLYTSPSPRD